MPEPVHNVEGLNCPNCGAPQTIRGFGQTLTVVCGSCHSILDAKDPKHQVLQRFQAAQRVHPLIPLGQRGKLHGTVYEAIGFQQRSTTIEGVTYSWREYVLFNPYKGFRYLTEYDGHWNDVKAIDSVPVRGSAGGRPNVTYLNRRFSHFQTGAATTTFVLGEFPWQVRFGEKVQFKDYVSPPLMLSEETTEGETTWSLGEYMTGARVWEAFKLESQPPPPIGVFSNQPAPDLHVRGIWAAFMFLALALCVLALGVAVFASSEEVFRGAYIFGQNQPPFVTDTFDLKGRPSDVAVETRSQPNISAYFRYALINSDSGRAWDFARELGEDGRDTAVVPSVPAGKYYLRVEVEHDGAGGVNYEIRVRRNVPVATFYWIAFFLLLIPPILRTISAGRFEARRWKESDYAGG